MSKFKNWWYKFVGKITGSNKTSKPVERVAAWQHDNENARLNGYTSGRYGGKMVDYLDKSAIKSMMERDKTIENDHAKNFGGKLLRVARLLFPDTIVDELGNSSSASPSVEVGPFSGEYEDGTSFDSYTGGNIDLVKDVPFSDLGSSVLPAAAGAAVDSSQSVQNAVPAVDVTSSAPDTAMSASVGAKGSVFGNLLAGVGAAVGSGLFDLFNYRRQRRDYLEDRAHQEEREDTATQRAVEDAIAAGLSPQTVTNGSSSNSAPMQAYNGNDVFRDILDTAMSVQNFRESQENLDSLSLANQQARQDLSVFNLKVVDMMQDLTAKKVQIEAMKEDVRGRKYDNDIMRPLLAAERQVDLGISQLERDSYQQRLEHDLTYEGDKHYDYLVRHFGKEFADKVAKRDASGSFGRAISTVGTVGGLALGAGSLLSKFVRKNGVGAAASVLSAPLNISNRFYTPTYSSSY